MIASMALIAPTSNHEDHVEPAIMGMDQRNLVSPVGALSQNLGSDERPDACVRDLASAFDVGGPCLVAIRRNSNLERLPRPGLRSMSVCWAVELVTYTKYRCGEGRDPDDPNSSLASRKSLERIELTGEYEEESNGLGDQRHISSELVIRSAGREDLSAQQPTSKKNGKQLQEGERGEHESLYRVLSKVRGLWRIKDNPMHRYKFM
jgi:hypothetical protein